MTKIVILSDTHNEHMKIPDIPSGDILIHCGDATVYGKPAELDDFLSWFSWQPHKYKIFVPGNHDEGLYFPGQQPLFKNVRIPKEIIYLEGRYVEIEGLKIYGAPWRPRPEWAREYKPGKWAAFGVNHDEINRKWDKIPDGLDILITHVPPLMYLDRHRTLTHGGCPELQKALMAKRPRIHCFGHIHNSYGQLKTEFTHFVNAALCDDSYDLVNEPMVVEI